MKDYAGGDTTFDEAGVNFPIGITQRQYNVTVNTVISNAPCNVITVKGNNNDFIFQAVLPVGTNDLYIRRWNKGSAVWTTLTKINATGTNNLNWSTALAASGSGALDALLTTYPTDKITVTKIRSGVANDYLTTEGGILKTYSYGDDTQFNYQEFTSVVTQRTFKRGWLDATNVWNNWRLISNFECTTAVRTALPFVYVGMKIYDTTLLKPVYVKSLSPTVWTDATGVAV